MKKILLSVCTCIVVLLASQDLEAQTFKVGVFDLDLMVQAMPGYHAVDSLVQVYEKDSLGAEYEYYQLEYQRLDSTYKADSGLVATGKKAAALLDFTKQERQKMAMNIVYWQQIAQNKSSNKRSQLASPLFQTVANAYKKVLDRKKYHLIVKPQTYEAGFPIDNIFISVARELKLSGLPQELVYLGDDPDAKPQAAKPAATKPK
jgi:Skp family chaperone for outer membrane proteins